MDRYFTVVTVKGLKNARGGHYKGDTPMIVAKKVALRLFDENRRVEYSV